MGQGAVLCVCIGKTFCTRVGCASSAVLGTRMAAASLRVQESGRGGRARASHMVVGRCRVGGGGRGRTCCTLFACTRCGIPAAGGLHRGHIGGQYKRDVGSCLSTRDWTCSSWHGLGVPTSTWYRAYVLYLSGR